MKPIWLSVAFFGGEFGGNRPPANGELPESFGEEGIPFFFRGMPLLKLAGKATKKIEMEGRKAQLPGGTAPKGKGMEEFEGYTLLPPNWGLAAIFAFLFMMGKIWRGKMLVGWWMHLPSSTFRL